MPQVYHASKLLILCFLSVELFFFGFLSDLLNIIGLLAKHALSLHHDRPNFALVYVCLADHELLYFLCIVYVVRLKTQMFMDEPVVGLRLPKL